VKGKSNFLGFWVFRIFLADGVVVLPPKNSKNFLQNYFLFSQFCEFIFLRILLSAGERKLTSRIIKISFNLMLIFFNQVHFKNGSRAAWKFAVATVVATTLPSLSFKQPACSGLADCRVF